MKNLELNEMFKVALDSMPHRFSGHIFAKKCNILGCPKFYSDPNCYHDFADKIKTERAKFLKNNCTKVARMTYEKIIPVSLPLCDERTCIEYLKSTGNYRIQYKEIIQNEIWHEL